MKLLYVGLVLISSVLLYAQVEPPPFQPMTNSPVLLQSDSDHLYVEGNWISVDKQPLSGPSVSEISCDRAEGQCHEAQANIMVVSKGIFTLVAASVDYKIIRWNSREVVAQNAPTGICRVVNVLKVDLQAKKVFALQTLSEPVDSSLPQMGKDICNAAGLNLELRDKTAFAYDAK